MAFGTLIGGERDPRGKMGVLGAFARIIFCRVLCKWCVGVLAEAGSAFSVHFLFSYTKRGENLVENVLGTHFTGYFAQCLENILKVEGDNIQWLFGGEAFANP